MHKVLVLIQGHDVLGVFENKETLVKSVELSHPGNKFIVADNWMKVVDQSTRKEILFSIKKSFLFCVPQTGI